MAKKPFLPPKLPPKIDYGALIEEIGEANRYIGELKGSTLNLPNPDLLTSPLLTKEAVASSAIEGTQATLEDVLEYEAQQRRSERDEKERDIREIINYRQAVRVAVEETKKKPIGENLIKKVHYVLLDSVRGADKDRGNLRRRQVFIGPPGASIKDATYVPPPATEISSLLSNWEYYLNSSDERDPLIQIGVAHYQFEAIHPFLDGNGRIGRLLIPLFLFQRGLLSYPVLYISGYLEEHRGDYYRLLDGVDKEGDWTSWLKFFLGALSITSLATKGTVLEILVLREELKIKIQEINSMYASRLLDIIFRMPIVSFAVVKEQLGAKSGQTVYNLLSKFIEAGVLEEISGRKRNRVFVFKQLLEILK